VKDPEAAKTAKGNYYDDKGRRVVFAKRANQGSLERHSTLDSKTERSQSDEILSLVNEHHQGSKF